MILLIFSTYLSFIEPVFMQNIINFQIEVLDAATPKYKVSYKSLESEEEFSEEFNTVRLIMVLVGFCQFSYLTPIFGYILFLLKIPTK